MPYPAYPTVPHPCGTAIWPASDPGDPTITPDPGLFIQDGNDGSFDMCEGEDGSLQGDFIVTGCGTRNFGQGNLKLLLPKGKDGDVTILKAVLIINTYVSDIVDDPSALEPYTFTHESGGVQVLVDGFEFWCGSTCWNNPATAPPSFPVTTYLRNRIYMYNLTGYVSTKKSGNYTVGGLPLTTPLMAISTDGDRLPGCASSQGAVLFVIYRSNKGNARCVQTYAGARLISAGGPWGGVISQLIKFNQTPGSIAFTGNARISLAAGDTQASVSGDRANINNTPFLPSTNSFRKIGSSLSVITQNMSNIYAGTNQAIVETSNDCVAWFLLVTSADETQPKADFKPVICVSTTLQQALPAAQLAMLVNGNNSINPFPANCNNVANNQFPDAPFYVRIDNEIILVTAKKNFEDAPAIVPPNQEPREWTILRGAGGTTPAAHTVDACVKLVMPVEGKSVMQAALAKRGMPNMRPNAGRINQRNRIQGF